jgi:hypothetical protein
MSRKPVRVDVEPLVGEIRSAEGVNAAFRQAEEVRRATAEHEGYVSSYDDLTRQIEGLDAERAKRLQAAEFPVEGLSVEGDAVLYRGVPLADCSQSERLRVLAGIGVALNPRLAFCILRDAAWFDPDTMRTFLADMSARGIQVIAERPGRDEFATIVLEAGRVVGAASEAEVAVEAVPAAVEEVEVVAVAPVMLDDEEFWR